jgi:nitrite reductase/ring-hydroxylating ferredoxin subunit
MSSTKIVFTLIFATIISVFSSCVEEEPVIVPDVYVYIRINLDLPQYNHLKSINNALKINNEGYNNNGVIVYRLSQDDYYAFDATCPQHINVSTSINLDDSGSGGGATCPHCNTTYSFFNYGQANNGYPLKRYKVSLSGIYLTVSN